MTRTTHKLTTPSEVRLAARSGTHRGPTAGLCSGHVQANLLVLPAAYAADFRRLCARNPVACPLLAESRKPGDKGFAKGVAEGCDITTDVPGYNVYQDGKLVKDDVESIEKWWGHDSVAFLSMSQPKQRGKNGTGG